MKEPLVFVGSALPANIRPGANIMKLFLSVIYEYS
jgi:hypothetical protein